MKKMIMMMVMMLTIAASANAMNGRQASVEAQQLTEHMSRQLGLARHQIDKVYDINYQYLRQVGTRNELKAKNHRQHQLERVLTPAQMNRLLAGASHHNASWRRPAPVRHAPSHHGIH